MNEPRTMHNFVAAVSPDTVTIEPARADLVRRQDVVNVVDRMITAYSDQQGALLDQVQGETTRGGFLSGADQVRERRKTSRMYLLTYGAVAAMTTGGLSFMATLAGMDGGLSIAGWLFATGALTLLLAWHRHGDEFKHSPEGIARHVIDAHWDVASYESETRRLSMQWEHDAEARRQAAQECAAEHGRQLAQLRVAELEARRRAIEAQRAQVDPYEGRFRVVMGTESPQTLQDGAGRTETALQVSSIDSDAETRTDGTAGDSWQAALLQWVVTLYEPGNMTADGIIRQRAPWAARSPWVESDKAAARRVCCEMYPKLIEPAAGGQWRLRREMFTDADQALQVVSPRLS